jgi:hypothetical protein
MVVQYFARAWGLTLCAWVRRGPHASFRMPFVGVLGRLGPPSVEAPTWGMGRGEFSMLHLFFLGLCTVF